MFAQRAVLPSIEPSVFERYGDVKLTCSVLSEIQIAATPPRVKKIARKTEADLREVATRSNATLEAWDRLARAMGLEGPDEAPAPHALIKEVLRGGQIPKINYIVDIANITALRFASPVGVFDLDKLRPPITLRCAEPGDFIVPILSSQPIPCTPGEIVYGDSTRVFSRYSRDADFSKITDDTHNVLCVIDGAPGVPKQLVDEAMTFMLALIRDVASAGLEILGPVALGDG